MGHGARTLSPCAAMWRSTRASRRAIHAMPSFPSRARGCTRSPSVRCMPASSSPGISALADHREAEMPGLEIPVGPVHAGIIEPGHFRFSVVGERVLRLEERLGYTHKGVEKRFESLSLEEGARLAARVSGDSSVAFSWAYAMALETAAACKVPARALWLRALLLERERVANHLGDLGALGNDGGLAFGLAQFSRMKEDLLRNNTALFGHRYLMDRVVAGGVTVDLDAAGADSILAEADRLEDELRTLRDRKSTR